LPAASADKVDRREQGAIEAVAAGGQDELGAARCDERADAGALDRGRGGGSSRCSMTAAGGVAGSASYAIVVGEKNGGRPQKKRRTGSSVRGKASSRLKGEVIEGTARAVGWKDWAPHVLSASGRRSRFSALQRRWPAAIRAVGGPQQRRLVAHIGDVWRCAGAANGGQSRQSAGGGPIVDGWGIRYPRLAVSDRGSVGFRGGVPQEQATCGPQLLCAPVTQLTARGESPGGAQMPEALLRGECAGNRWGGKLVTDFNVGWPLLVSQGLSGSRIEADGRCGETRSALLIPTHPARKQS